MMAFLRKAMPFLYGKDHPPFTRAGDSLRSYSRKGIEIDQLVIHESVTRTAADAVKVLKRRKLGVHYCIDRDGTISHHAPVAKATAHGGAGHNRRSIGIEVINPYYPKYAKGADKVGAVWAHKKEYVLPTDAQLRSLHKLVCWLVVKWDIPVTFPGVQSDHFIWGRIIEHNTPGVMAHHRWAHADGLFCEHYLLCRLSGADHEYALGLTMDAVASKRRTTQFHEDADEPPENIA